MSAADLLAPYGFNSLRTMARARGYALEKLRRPELLDVLGDRLFSMDEVAELVARLPARDRAVLEEMARRGGRAATPELLESLAPHGIEPSLPARPRESLDRIAPDTRRFDEICARLTGHGLLFTESETRGPLAQPLNLNPGTILVVPGIVLLALRTVDHPEPVSVTPTVVPADGGTTWLRDMRRYADLIRESRLAIDPRSQLLTPVSMRYVLTTFTDEVLDADERAHTRWWLMRSMLLAAGIATIRRDRLIPERGTHFFEQEVPDQLQALAAAYVQEETWLELDELDPRRVREWRQHILAGGPTSGHESWLALDDLRPPAPDGERWGAFRQAALLGPLRWFGLVELQLAGDQLTHYRWTELGRFVAGRGPRPQIVRGRLIVQPSFTLLLLPPFDDPTLARLDAVAERSRTSETIEWRLVEQRWYDALHQGHIGEDVIGWLAQRAGIPLPQNVAYTLHEWSKRLDQVVLWEDAAVIAAPSEILDRLEQHPDLNPLVIERAGPERLLLRRGVAVERALAMAGERPILRRYDRAPTRPQLTIASDGTIELIRAGPTSAGNLLLPILLQRFCRSRGQDRYQIDADGWRRAAAEAPDGVTGLLNLLRSHARVLPPALVTRLKVWAEPAPVVLEQPLVLRLRPEQLNILRADPELAPLLEQPYAPGDALIALREDDAAALRALLAERGIDI